MIGYNVYDGSRLVIECSSPEDAEAFIALHRIVGSTWVRERLAPLSSEEAALRARIAQQAGNGPRDS